jgi:hypothetical protein
MISIQAHFDGKVIVPHDPVDLPRDQALIVRIEPARSLFPRARNRAWIGWLSILLIAQPYPPICPLSTITTCTVHRRTMVKSSLTSWLRPCIGKRANSLPWGAANRNANRPVSAIWERFIYTTFFGRRQCAGLEAQTSIGHT